jgi:hypothetical protein
MPVEVKIRSAPPGLPDCPAHRRSGSGAGQLDETLEWILADKPAEHWILVAAPQVVERGAGIKCLARINLFSVPTCGPGALMFRCSQNVV